MRVRTLALAVGCLLLTGGVALPQTAEIQKQVDEKLAQARKDQATLEELLGQALKNNPDIRVAETKLREAEAELYRTRMKVLSRIVALQYELRSTKAAADEAAARYEREKTLFARSQSSPADLSAAQACKDKFWADYAGVQAQLDLLFSKEASKRLGTIEGGLQALTDARIVRIWDIASGKGIKPQPAAAPEPAPVQEALADKIRKALDTPLPVDVKGEVDGEDVLRLLRQHIKGVNIQANVKGAYRAKLEFSEPIPLGAFLQWTEDQFGWRFIVRDYGIVVTHYAVPPGAVFLLDLWRKGKGPSAGP
jgi:hypothetical protein